MGWPDDTEVDLGILATLGVFGPRFDEKERPFLRVAAPESTADGTKAVDKRPLVKWLKGATTDAETVAKWWGALFPGAWSGVHAQRTRRRPFLGRHRTGVLEGVGVVLSGLVRFEGLALGVAAITRSEGIGIQFFVERVAVDFEFIILGFGILQRLLDGGRRFGR